MSDKLDHLLNISYTLGMSYFLDEQAMRTRIGQWGGSCAIRRPKMAVETLGLHEGEHVDLHIEEGALVLRPSRPLYDLAEMVDAARKQVAPEPWDDSAVGTEQL